MYGTYTRSEASTFTEARARVVFPKIFADVVHLEISGILSNCRSESWKEILSYGLTVNAFKNFEIKLHKPNGTKEAFRYYVKDDGSLLGNDDSGGINFYSYPSGTKVSIIVTRKQQFVNDEQLDFLFDKHGWTSGGEYLEGKEIYDRVFSKDGYGISRTRIIQ